MLIEGRANCCVFRFPVPILQSLSPTARAERCGCHVSSNPWLIIVESQATRSIEHAKDLENITITRVAMKLVPFEELATAAAEILSITCSVKAQHKSFPARRTNARAKSRWGWLFLHDNS